MIKTPFRPAFTALFLTFFFFFYFSLMSALPFNKSGRLFGLNYNLLVYLVGLILAWLGCLFLVPVAAERISARPAVLRWLYAAFFVAALTIHCEIDFIDRMCSYAYADYLYLTYLMRGETLWDAFALRSIPLLGHSLGLLVLFLLSFAVISVRTEYRKKQINRLYRIAVVSVLSALCAMLCYAPNLFRNSVWRLHHVHAYTNSIVNVLYLQPYDDVRSAIYGHYGILYLPFLKLFGSRLSAITVTISLFTFLTFFCIGRILSFLIEDDLHFTASMLAVAALCGTFFEGGQYFQFLPHRFLFPALTISLLIAEEKRSTCPAPRTAWILTELTLGALSLLFNLETGLVCLLLICAYHVFQRLEGMPVSLENLSVRLTCRRVAEFIALEAAKAMLFSAACFFSAYAAVNCYNILVGGHVLGLRAFVYPFGSAEYDTFTILRTGLLSPLLHPWEDLGSRMNYFYLSGWKVHQGRKSALDRLARLL